MSAERDVVVHDLKVWPEFFAALWDGSKAFEWRKDDRDYRVGDVLILREWSEATGYTGRGTKRTIGYILRDRMGMPSGYAVLGFNETARVDAEWRARVEGARKKVRPVTCRKCSPGSACADALREAEESAHNRALDALLTAVARDREAPKDCQAGGPCAGCPGCQTGYEVPTNTKCPRCGYVTADPFNCPTCKKPTPTPEAARAE